LANLATTGTTLVVEFGTLQDKYSRPSLLQTQCPSGVGILYIRIYIKLSRFIKMLITSKADSKKAILSVAPAPRAVQEYGT